MYIKHVHTEKHTHAICVIHVHDTVHVQLMALYALMTSGDKIVASKTLYGGTVTQFSRTILKVCE